MRPALVILLLVATTALFQSRSWGWDLPTPAVALLSLITLGGALAGTAGLIASWRGLRGKGRGWPFLLNALAALIALALWLNQLLAQVAASQGSPLERGLLALVLGWMLSPFAGWLLTRLGERLAQR